MAGPTTLFQTGNHASRPAATAGCVLYSCTTHSIVYRSDGSSWTSWMTIPTGASVATDALFDAKGDSAWGTGADTAAKLTAGSNGMVPVYDSAQSTGVKTAYPPGYEFDYAQITSNASITATTEATANTVVTANAVTYDGSTTIMVEFYSYALQPDSGAAGRTLTLFLYDGSSSIGFIQSVKTAVISQDARQVGRAAVRLTPSAAAHTYSIRAAVSAGTGTVNAGAGGSAAVVPAFIRQTKV